MSLVTKGREEQLRKSSYIGDHVLNAVTSKRGQGRIWALFLSLFLVSTYFFVSLSRKSSWPMDMLRPCAETPRMVTDDAYTAPRNSPHGYSHAAVAADTSTCAKVAGNILSIGGTAVDAVVASLICNGVINSHTSGLGGGFFMTIYDEHTRRAAVLNARETAPAAATVDMFKDNVNSMRGPRASGVPGEIRGFWEARRAYGNPALSWRQIIQPSIELCLNGITVSKVHAHALKVRRGQISSDPGMRAVFFNEPENRTWVEGEIYRRPDLARTLNILAEKGESAFYDGQLGQQLVADSQKAGGIITMDDLRNYRVRWMTPISLDLEQGQSQIFTTPPPASGPVLGGILSLMSKFKHTTDSLFFYHRLAESFKHAYGVRTRIGDPGAHPEAVDDILNAAEELISDEWAKSVFHKVNDGMTFNESSYYGAQYDVVHDHGTAPVVVKDGNGLAVAVISSINLFFGCSFMSPSTGILLNNQMNDFSYPGVINNFLQHPSPNNAMKPGRAPISSMVPSIIVDKLTGKVKLLIAASGGTKIITSVAQTLIRHLYLHEDLHHAIDSRRLHHQLQPDWIEYEPGVPRDAIEFMASRGHATLKGKPGLHEAFVVGLRIDQECPQLSG